MRHLFTLSSIPPRFGMIGPALKSLLAQKSRPEAVELWIPRTYRRFPQWGGALPDVPDGVTIRRTDEDLGPATKILPAVRSRQGQDIDLIYVDDDRIFAPDWGERCLSVRRDHPHAAICGAGFHVWRYGYRSADGPEPRAVPTLGPRLQVATYLRRASRFFRRSADVETEAAWRRFTRSGHVDIAAGYGGVMVRPAFFGDDAFRIPPMHWIVDDIWLSGMLTWAGVNIWADRHLFDVREILATSRHFALYKMVIEGKGRISANKACIEHMRDAYGIWGGVPTRDA